MESDSIYNLESSMLNPRLPKMVYGFLLFSGILDAIPSAASATVPEGYQAIAITNHPDVP